MPAPSLQSQIVEEEPEGDELNLRELWQVIVKRRWTIVIFALIVVTAVVTATYLMTPIYRASLTLQIDREDIKIVKTGEVAPDETGWDGQDYLPDPVRTVEKPQPGAAGGQPVGAGRSPAAAALAAGRIQGVAGRLVAQGQRGERPWQATLGKRPARRRRRAVSWAA